jgi:hypothetical protein
MTRTRYLIAAMIALSGFWELGRARGSAPADSVTTAEVSGRRGKRIPFPATPYDTTTGVEFSERHAFSFDHFLETRPAILMERRGPVGGDAGFSRYGIGRGRGALYLGYIPLNDPQDDRMPLALVPTTRVGLVAPGDSEGIFQFDRGNIEGAWRIAEPPPPADRPLVAIELSKGDRDLRQRRLSFSSTEGPVGIDFAFDELLDDGYQFDERGEVLGLSYGKSTTRIQGGNVRGKLPGGDYVFTFRRFTNAFDGDLFSDQSELRRDGHFAAARTSFDDLGLTIFERRHESSAVDLAVGSTVPDSTTSNQTTGAYVTTPVSFGERATLELGAGYEDIHSVQAVGDSESRSRLQKGHAGVTGVFEPARDLVVGVEANATHYFDSRTGWGAGVTASGNLGQDHRMVLALKRRFRLPNLGEMFQPRHSERLSGSADLTGNPSVGPESALEGSARWFARLGVFSNEVGATALRVSDPIAFQTVSTGGGVDVRSPQNGSSEELVVIEERADVGFFLGSTRFELAGSFEYSPGDRVGFFSGVPEYRATARASIGRDLFKKTSGVWFGAEFVRCGERVSGSVDPLGAYDFLNLKFTVRLVEARLYVQWLNVRDERYQTVWPYLMTPRTFVYGVQWTIFD